MNQKQPKLRVSNRLRVLRAQENLTQEQLAADVGVTRVTINCVERGEYLPSLELGLLLARRFGLTVEEVFIVEENQHEKNRA
jgi:putative transcriptional regulator